MKKVFTHKYFSFISAGLVFSALLFFKFQAMAPTTVEEIPVLQEEKVVEEQMVVKPDEVVTNGIYLTMFTASNENRLQHFIDLAKETNVNAFVIDMKDYSGRIAYDSEVAKQWGTNSERPLIKDLHALIEKLRANDIYAIARVTIFQDPKLAIERPDLAVQRKDTNTPWMDHKGLTWLDPGARETWEYHVDLLKEIISYGFDEVNLDYIRFPSDGYVSLMEFTHLPEEFQRRDVLREFIAYVSEQLEKESAYLSVDLFGFVTTKEDDLQVGQVLEDFAPYVDYISPMVYPSHYPSGYMNLENPALYPYAVINLAMEKGNERLEQLEGNRAKLRPWLQDFDIGAVYTKERINEQIRAVNDHENAGWLMWNARNVYTEDVFK